jgi:hypothetical protein
MNKLDILLENLVRNHAQNLGLSSRNENQMVKEISILTFRGYNTRAELITLIKNAMVTK